ncbi:unnamed protein product, partial [Candidula unifasciata]
EYNFLSRDGQELSDLKQKVVEQEKLMNCLKEEKDSLIRQLSEAKASQIQEARGHRQKIHDLELKLIGSEMECTDKEIKFTEHLANNPA